MAHFLFSHWLNKLLPTAALSVALQCSASAQQPTPLFQSIDHWSGPGNSTSLTVPGAVKWRYPDGPRGAYNHGFRVLNDSAADWYNYSGIEFEVQGAGGADTELTVGLSAIEGLRAGAPITAKVAVKGDGWQKISLPWSAFDVPRARRGFLLGVKEIQISAKGQQGSAGSLSIRNVRAVKAPVISLESEVRGKSVNAGETAEYTVSVGNVTDQPQAVTLSFASYGWEALKPTVDPCLLSLAPGETKPVTVRVPVPGNIPPGGHERQVLQAISNGNGVTELALVTACALPHPNILHTKAAWDEVREKVRKYEWAKKAQDSFVATADKWKVPDIAKPPGNDPKDTYGPYVFSTTATEQGMMSASIAWQLTGKKVYAEKVAEFLRKLSDPEKGYPQTLRACGNALVQEGGYFQHIAMAYDGILDSGVLSDTDRTQIERTFRLLMETIDRACLNSPINNWNVAEITGALYCALAVQDLSAAERYFYGPGGVCDQLAKGVMDDGWWFECTISYNAWVASEFSQTALALEPWGINFKDQHVPASYASSMMLVPMLSGGTKFTVGPDQPSDRPFGMSGEIFGPQRTSYRDIRQMWNSLLPFLDYRGVMVGVNDSVERFQADTRGEIFASPFELAYYLFRDPAYAALAKLNKGKRDLLYGVPELPENTPEYFRHSAFADNVGLVMLRSQTENRPIREQLQAALHYGTHGWAHGHYDRTDLLSLMRYGRSFYNPESLWYGYGNFMYKFYAQNSLAHNMVLVDEKNQEASPGKRLLFHSGKLMQATAVETTARWSNPPYGGMVYDVAGGMTFEEKAWSEGRYVPIPKDAPGYGTLTGYTEPILQRRLMIVTDDYVVLADYLKGAKAHTYENVIQLKGVHGVNASEKAFLRHDAQWNPDPVGSAQFVTDCNWFAAKAPAKCESEMHFGPGQDDARAVNPALEPGALKLDVYSLWPKAQEIMVGTAPEFFPVEKQLFYAVRGDGKVLNEGKFGAWVLGQGEIDVPVEGVSRLDLETKVALSKKETVFWGNARIVTKDGKELPLRELAPRFENVIQPKELNKDYFGGPVKIAGIEQKTSLGGQPQDESKPGIIHINLAGKNAARFKATIGGDYPLGNEAERRKVYAIKPAVANTSEALFLTVLEPYEDKSAVAKAEALTSDKLRVSLRDGRVQDISIKNFTGSGQDVEVSLHESKAGVDRVESTQIPKNANN